MAPPAISRMTPLTVEWSSIGYGDTGVWQTLGRMRQEMTRALRDPVVIETARDILAESVPFDYEDHARRIYEWLRERYRYVHDPTEFELLLTPRRMLDTMRERGYAQEDCESIATLAATLLEAVGIPTRFRVVEKAPGQGYVHVYTEALIDSARWFPLDLTIPEPFGSRPKVTGREQVYPPPVEVEMRNQLVPAFLGQDSGGSLIDWSAITGGISTVTGQVLPLLERYGVLEPQVGPSRLPLPGEDIYAYALTEPFYRSRLIQPLQSTAQWFLIIGGGALLLWMLAGRRGRSS